MTTPKQPNAHGDCPECGAHFRLYRAWQKFCSPKCRDRRKAREMRAAARAFRQQLAESRQGRG